MEETLGLLSSRFPCSIAGRYKHIEIPPIPRIFTTNHAMVGDSSIFPTTYPDDTPLSADHTAALQRRFRVVHVPGPMWEPEAPPAA